MANEDGGDGHSNRTTPTSPKDYIASVEKPGLRIFLQFARAVAELVNEFGMPIALFAVGITMIVLSFGSLTEELKMIVAGLLVVLGVLLYMRVYDREHPPKTGHAVSDQLDRMTKLVEGFIESRVDRQDPP